MNTIKTKIKNGIAICQFVNTHYSNPFSISRMRELTVELSELNENHNVKSVVLYGGDGNSFCVGGDFNEVSKFTGGDEVDEWIDVISDLYVGILSLTKPIIASVDKYCIGIGFQVAICCDIRIASEDAIFEMPELKKGISCVFGGLMLEDFFDRAAMLDMLYYEHCLDAERARNLSLVSEVVEGRSLDSSEVYAERIRDYPSVAILKTKPVINAQFIETVETARRTAKKAHRASFKDGSAQEEMKTIISPSVRTA